MNYYYLLAIKPYNLFCDGVAQDCLCMKFCGFVVFMGHVKFSSSKVEWNYENIEKESYNWEKSFRKETQFLRHTLM